MTNAATRPARSLVDILAPLQFRAETHPAGLAIDLLWQLPDPAQSTDSNALNQAVNRVALTIQRRERRFPGKSRRGSLPVLADENDLFDGTQIYNTSTFRFDWEDVRQELEGQCQVTTVRQYQRLPPNNRLIRTIRHESAEDGSPLRTLVCFIDWAGLLPDAIYYYTAFREQIDGESQRFWFSRLSQASALAIFDYGHSLFHKLPQIHQQLDTTYPDSEQIALADQQKGQLQRFLEVLDAHTNLLHGSIEGLRDLHNPRRADSRLIPHLSHLLGWRLKNNLDEDEQRNEVQFAPEVYRTVGTIPNIGAIINRLTGWKVEVREFAHNVLRSVDTTRFEALENGSRVYLDGNLNRRSPVGSINTNDAEAMFKLRNQAFDDTTAYTYDCRQPSRQESHLSESIRYSRETIGIYISADVKSETFSPEETTERIRQVLAEFLPIQVCPIFFIKDTPVEDEIVYDERQIADEEPDGGAIGILQETDGYDTIIRDVASDQILGWHWLRSWSQSSPIVDRSVNTSLSPIDTSSRTPHTGLNQPFEEDGEDS